MTPTILMRPLAFLIVGLTAIALPKAACGQARRYPLATSDVLRLHNATAEVVTFKGKLGVRLTVAPEIERRPEYIAGQKALRSGDWKYLVTADGESLFDLATDPGEKSDVKDRHPEVLAALREKYAGWEREMLPPVPLDPATR